MENFITIEDYSASVHREILNALVRDDKEVIEVCEDRAIDELKCYLTQRYDIEAIFSAQGNERNQLILMMAIDIAVYHIFCIHNPHNMSAIRKERYDRAMAWARDVGKGRISISNAPMLPEEEQPSSLLIGGSKRRNNHM